MDLDPGALNPGGPRGSRLCACHRDEDSTGFLNHAKGPPTFWRPPQIVSTDGLPLAALGHLMSGGDLLSQGTAPQVPSALAGFTSVFGMGTGGSPPLTPPDKSSSVRDNPSTP